MASEHASETKESVYTTPSDSILEKIPHGLDAVGPQPGQDEEKLDMADEQIERSTSNDEPIYPPMITKVAVGIGLALTIFLVALDQTIVATAIPTISDHFKALNDVVLSASEIDDRTALQPTFGKLYKVFNVKWTFLVAVSVFEIGSLICALAPTSNTLIVGRAIAGAGGAGIFSGTFTVISYIVPLRERPMFFASVGAVNAVASVAGPLAGGAFTEHVSWRWCFYINLPIGAITILTIALLLPVPRQPLTSLPLREKFSEVDIFGAFFLLPAVVCLLLALQWGGTVYAWNSSRIIGLFVGFGIMIIIFIIIQVIRGDKATLPISVLKQRTVASATLFCLLMGASIFIMIYYIPIYFQAIKGSSPSHSGLQLLPLMLAIVIFSFITGGLVQWWGYYTPFIIAGTAIFTVGAGLCTMFTVDQSNWRAYGFIIVAGTGFGLSFQNAFMSVQAVLPQKTLSIGNSLIMFANTLSGALFLAISNSILSNGLVNRLSTTVPSLNPQTIIGAGATGLRTMVSPDLLPLVLQAYNSAVRDVFRISIVTGGITFLASWCFEWKSIKGKDLTAGMV